MYSGSLSASISRPYTPTSNDEERSWIEFVVKVYPNRLLPNYLADLKIGDEVEMRGPEGAMKYSKTYSKHILMIAGGTGITPMYHLSRAMCSDGSNSTTVSAVRQQHGG